MFKFKIFVVAKGGKQVDKRIKVFVDFTICDNSIGVIFNSGPSYQPYGPTLTWNTLSDSGSAVDNILVPITGWSTTSNTICPIESF